MELNFGGGGTPIFKKKATIPIVRSSKSFFRPQGLKQVGHPQAPEGNELAYTRKIPSSVLLSHHPLYNTS